MDVLQGISRAPCLIYLRMELIATCAKTNRCALLEFLPGSVCRRMGLAGEFPGFVLPADGSILDGFVAQEKVKGVEMVASCSSRSW